MERYQLTLAYDGTEFNGFQRQAKTSKSRTVQGVIETALEEMGWQGNSILFAGRTDAGVHASGQVIAFDLDWRHGCFSLISAMNARLPQDVAVQAAENSRAEFHPRFDAKSRRYRYRTNCESTRNPFTDRFVWRIRPPLNTGRLDQIASLLTGTRDFAAFGSSPTSGGSTVRTVFSASWKEYGAEIVFDISANAFLYHMVRRLVHFQVTADQKKTDINNLRKCIESSSSFQAQGLAPAKGLNLVEVEY